MFDRHGRGDAGDGVHGRFFELFDKLTSVGVEAVEVAALAFGKKDVKGEGAFAGTGEAREDDELVEGKAEVEIFQVMMASPVNLDGSGWGGSPVASWRARCGSWGLSGCGGSEEWGEKLAGEACRMGRDGFGGAGDEELATAGTGFGAEVEDPIGGFDDFEVVFDDEERVTGVDETLKDLNQDANIVEVKTCGGFVEDQERG